MGFLLYRFCGIACRQQKYNALKIAESLGFHGKSPPEKTEMHSGAGLVIVPGK
jgi:hypothetical protein